MIATALQVLLISVRSMAWSALELGVALYFGLMISFMLR